MKRLAAILILLAVVRLALMAFTPVFDPSEARYAAIAANMARTGDFVVPHFTHEGRYQSFDGKPPLVFQAGGACIRALGASRPVTLQLGARLFPFASALVVLAILYGTMRRRDGAEKALLAVCVCATVTAFYAAAGLAMTDMTLTCCVAGALLRYSVFRETPCLTSAAGVMALLGAGMIVKGPVALVLFGLPVFCDACFNRMWRRVFDWRWAAALPVFLLVAVPWFVLVEQRNPGSVWYFFYNENFLRFVTHDYGDKYGAGREAFRGVSVIWAFVATLPWTLVEVGKWGSGKVGKLRSWKVGKLGSWGVGMLRSFSFEFWTMAAMVGFWCLTSRVLLYYLFPIIPLFAAWFVRRNAAATLRRLVPVAAALTLVVTCGALLGGRICSDKMRGAATPEYYGFRNRYSHEFYHGTDPACLGKGIGPKEQAALFRLLQEEKRQRKEASK